MNIFTKSALTFAAASTIATAALASPGDASYGELTSSRAKVISLESQLRNAGADVSTDADTNAAISFDEKAALLSQKVEDLQLQLNEFRSTRSE